MDVNELISRPTKQASTPEEQGFDYTNLSAQTEMVVQQCANEIKNLMKRTSHDIVNIGHNLLEAKEQLGHGYFEAWLRAEFNWGQWTARKFMQVARQFKSVKFTDLSIDASALYFLAAPSTPQMVRQEALKLAEQGEVITCAKVKIIASEYKESAKAQVLATKPSTIDIPAESPRAAQIVDPNSDTLVKQQPENKLPKKTEALAQFQISNRSHDMTFDTDRDDCQPKDQTDTNIQMLFEVGSIVSFTNFGQQDQNFFGEVAEIKKATATEVEVIMKISLVSDIT